MIQKFFRSPKIKSAAAIVAVLLLGVVFAAVSHSGSSPLTTAVGAVFSPLNKLSASLSRALSGFEISFASSGKYLDEIDALKKQLSESTQKLADYERMKKKVEAYEKILELKERNPDYKLCYGTVIERDAADAGLTFVLDVGSLDGVNAGDPVLSDGNVVGLVKKANATTCVAMSVLDPRLSVGAYEINTGEQGFAEGDTVLMKRGLLRLSGLKSTTAVVSGGIVCTSGSGGVFPSGLIIGTAVTVENDPGDSAVYATVKPAAAFEDLSEVFVLTSFDGQGDKDDFTIDN